MESTEFETYQIGQDDKQYVLTRPAAKYLHISHDRIMVLITRGQLPARLFGSRYFVELETLKAFDISKYPARRGR